MGSTWWLVKRDKWSKKFCNVFLRSSFGSLNFIINVSSKMAKKKSKQDFLVNWFDIDSGSSVISWGLTFVEKRSKFGCSQDKQLRPAFFQQNHLIGKWQPDEWTLSASPFNGSKQNPRGYFINVVRWQLHRMIPVDWLAFHWQRHLVYLAFFRTTLFVTWFDRYFMGNIFFFISC